MKNLIVSFFFFFACVTSSCSPAQKVPAVSHVALVRIDASLYAEFLNKLDAEMSKIRLTRFGATPALKELHQRDVLFFDYRFQLSDKLGFLGGSDIIKTGLIEIFVYQDYFGEESARADALARLSSVLSAYATKLEVASNKNYGATKDLSPYR